MFRSIHGTFGGVAFLSDGMLTVDAQPRGFQRTTAKVVLAPSGSRLPVITDTSSSM